MSIRDRILKSHDLPTKTIDVPRWGGLITIQGVPIGSREFVTFVNAPLEDGAEPSVDEINKRTLVAAVVMGVVEDDGSRAFTWADADDLRAKHWRTVVDVATAVFDLAKGDEIVASIDEGKASSGPTPS